MPKWWPWGRRPGPAAPATPAARPEPVWQRLAAITPTTGDIRPTAHINGFTATLTTSQNPQFTRPVQLLTVDEHHRLPVLDLGPANPDPVAPTAAPAPAAQSWAPRLPSGQRAHVGTPVQRLSMDDEPAVVALPVVDTGSAPEPPRAMVQASDPDERRSLNPVVTHDASTELPDPSPSRPEPAAPAPTAIEHPAPPAPAVQRVTSEPDVSAAVLQRVSSPSSSAPSLPPLPATAPEVLHAPHVHTTDVHSATEVAAPLRRLHAVQRIDAVAPAAPPLPVVAAIPPRSPVRSETVEPTPELATAVQHTPDPADPHPVAVGDTDQPPAIVLPAVVTPQIGTGPTAETTAAADAPSVTFAHPSPTPAAVQRLTPQPNPTPLLSTRPAPTLGTTPETTTRAIEITDPPVAGTEVPTVTLDAVPATGQHETPTVQRSSAAVVTDAEIRREAARHLHPVSASIASRTQPPTVTRSADATPEVVRSVAPDLVPPVAVDARSPIGLVRADRTSEPPVVQRVSLPVVDNGPAAQSVAPQFSSPVPPAVQRSTGPTRRLVVLPPVRSAGDQGASPGAAPPPDSTEVFSSPRPVGLQRMFEGATHRGAQPLPAPVQTFRSSTDTPQFTTTAHDYDAATNTITFASPGTPSPPNAPSAPGAPSIQRETEEPAPAAETSAPVTAAPALTSAPAASGSGAPEAAGTDVDELVNRVYDTLAARLRTELWLDRERAGTLMDLGR